MTPDDDSFAHLFDECDHEGRCVPAREVFDFDPDDPEQCAEVISWTLDAVEMGGRRNDEATAELLTKVFRKGPEALFIAFICLASTVAVAISRAFGDQLTGPDKLWTMRTLGTPDDADPKDVDARLFAGEFMTVYMNDDEGGAQALFQTLVTKPVDEIHKALMAMLGQTCAMFMYCVNANPDAFPELFTEEEEEE